MQSNDDTFEKWWEELAYMVLDVHQNPKVIHAKAKREGWNKKKETLDLADSSKVRRNLMNDFDKTSPTDVQTLNFS